MMNIPVFKPYIGSDTMKAAVDALDLGWLGMGSYVKEFEEELAKYLELPPDYRLVAVNTCTSALHLALLSAGVGPGDEVITPALNNIGDFQAIGMCGARPVFVDICEDDLGINPDLIEQAITSKVKVIIALHYMGVPCKIDEVFRIAEKHNLRVIEDAAHGVGTRLENMPIGSYGDITVFSFDAIKTLTCIDGGAIVVPKASDADKLYPARLLGMTQSNDQLYSNSRAYKFDVYDQGYRYHLANLHASIGLSQLKKLPEFIVNRQNYCREYNRLLKDVLGIITPQTDFESMSIFHYVIRIKDGKRQALANFMKESGVDSGIHWLPGNRFTWLKDCRGSNNIPITDKVGDEILTLPLWSYMTYDVIKKVTDSIIKFFDKAEAHKNG
jgi:dTDP-4-amino-4,6-dideoxygalactose transaminase